MPDRATPFFDKFPEAICSFGLTHTFNDLWGREDETLEGISKRRRLVNLQRELQNVNEEIKVSLVSKVVGVDGWRSGRIRRDNMDASTGQWVQQSSINGDVSLPRSWGQIRERLVSCY